MWNKNYIHDYTGVCRVQYGKKSSHLKKITLTSLLALVTIIRYVLWLAKVSPLRLSRGVGAPVAHVAQSTLLVLWPVVGVSSWGIQCTLIILRTNYCLAPTLLAVAGFRYSLIFSS